MFSSVKAAVGYGVVAALLASASAVYGSQTVIIDLGSLDGRESFAMDINNAGQAVGYSTHVGGGLYEYHAVLWENGTITDLGVLGGGDWAQAQAINASGQVAGYSRVAPLPNWHPFMWQGGGLSDLGSAGGSQTAAYGINGPGWIVGSDNSIGAYYRDGSTFHDLDSPAPAGWIQLFDARDINDSLVIVGQGRTAGGLNHAYRYDVATNQALDLGALAIGEGIQSWATAISNSGIVVGYSENGDTYVAGGDELEVIHAFLWQDGPMLDLGTLGGHVSEAYDVNEHGQVVGTSSYASGGSGDEPMHAFLWDNGGMTDLNDLLPAGSGWELFEARGINDSGDIVGYGWIHGQLGMRAFLLLSVAEYTITDLGTLTSVDFSSARALNDVGQVVGYSAGSDGYSRAFLWENGVMTDLGTFTAEVGLAHDINNAGQVVGGTAWPDIAWLWDNGSTTYITAGESGGINGAGQVVGRMETGSGSRAFLWDSGALTDLGTLGGSYSRANAINDVGQVACSGYLANGNQHAFIWDSGVKTDLGTLGGDTSAAADINEAGHVVGRSWLVGGGWFQAYMYRDGTMRHLGTLGGYYADAEAINDLDQVVGFAATPDDFGQRSHAFIWQKGAMVDLNDLVVNGADWELEEAADINNAGQIVGVGLIAGREHGFLLTPYPWNVFVHGDLNCDGVVNNADIPAFVLALSDPSAYAAAYPDCDPLLGDVDGDGQFNNGDIPAFIELLTGN